VGTYQFVTIIEPAVNWRHCRRSRLTKENPSACSSGHHTPCSFVGTEDPDVVCKFQRETCSTINSPLKLARLAAQIAYRSHSNNSQLVMKLTQPNAAPEQTFWSDWCVSEGRASGKGLGSRVQKMEKEAEDRLDAKVAEMMSDVEKTGASDN
jgi:hypothetical protein